MDVHSKAIERVVERILEATKSRDLSIWIDWDHVRRPSNEDWESKVRFLPGRGEIVLVEDLAADEQRKQAIEGVLPYLPPGHCYVVRKTKDSKRSQQYYDGEAPSDLFGDPELFMVLLAGLGGARIIRCELTDEETGEEAKCFLLAHMGLEELLNSLKKQYYREIFHLKEWRRREIKRKYVPYVRCYGMLKSLGLSEERLKEIRLQLWHQYWEEYQDRYGERYGEERNRERRAFYRELERKSERIVQRWERWSEARRQEFSAGWAKGKGGPLIM